MKDYPKLKPTQSEEELLVSYVYAIPGQTTPPVLPEGVSVYAGVMAHLWCAKEINLLAQVPG